MGKSSANMLKTYTKIFVIFYHSLTCKHLFYFFLRWTPRFLYSFRLLLRQKSIHQFKNSKITPLNFLKIWFSTYAPNLSIGLRRRLGLMIEGRGRREEGWGSGRVHMIKSWMYNPGVRWHESGKHMLWKHISLSCKCLNTNR